MDPTAEYDIRYQDAAYKKEYRNYSNGFIGLEHRTFVKREESKDGLTPISSEEEIEYVRVPGSSTPVLIKTGQKKRRNKKKKKKTGARMLTMDDLESDVVGVGRISDDRDFNSSQPINYTAAPVIYNDMMRETVTITNHQTHSQQSTRQHYRSPVKSSFRSSPDHSRSPSSRRRSPPRKFSPVRSSTSFSPSVSNKHCPQKTTYQNKRNDDNHNEAYTSQLLKQVKAYNTTAITSKKQNRYKESSLKDKLNNMNKLNSDSKNTDNSSNNVTEQDIRNELIKKENIDEEGIDALRRLALGAQQQSKRNGNADDQYQQQKTINNNSQTSYFDSSDHNVEELLLRADALKTAVMNEGLFIKKRDKTIIKNEATYNDSLLNDDMELDSDSPTDQVEDTFVNSYLATDSIEKNKNQISDLEAPYSLSDVPVTSKSTSVDNIELSSTSLANTTVEYSNNSINNISTFSTNQQRTVNSKPIKDPLYDEVIRDLEKDYGPICRDNETNNKIPINSKSVPAPILRVNKNLQRSLLLKKIDNNNTGKVFKNAEVQPNSKTIPDDSLLISETTLTDKNINKNTNRLENKSDDNSNIQSTNNQLLKKKKDNLLTKVPRAKNLKKSESLSSENEKKRRSTVEEEELRTLALASFSKRPKQQPGQQSDSLIKESSDATKGSKKNNNILLEKQSSNIISTELTSNLLVNNNLQSDNGSSLLTIKSNTINKKKRPIITDSQDPPKKIIKRTVTEKMREKANEPTLSTTVSPVVQKKLIQNQKKIPSLLQTSNINKNNVKITDSVESLTSKITSTKKIQRMVINLGEDSDTNSDSGKPVLISKPTILKTPQSKSNKSLAGSDVDFEKKIKEFLRSQREKTESTASKSSDSDKTSQAMRHLPPSMLEEYRCLKQRAAELEKNKTNDKRTRNSDKSNSVKSTELMSTSKNPAKKIIKPGMIITNNTTSTSDNTLLTTKSINVSESTSSSSSKKEENRLKVIANCSQEILKGIPRANKKTYSLPNATDNVSCSTNEINAQNIDMKPSESTNNKITETVIRTISNDNHSLDNTNLSNNPIDELLTFEEIKVDPNIIESISNSPAVVESSSSVINWPTVSTENFSINNNYDKLIIQIPNTRDIDVASWRQVNIIKTNDDEKSESVNSQHEVAPPFLRILTADQLNMRANQTSLPIMMTTTATTEEMTTTSSNQEQFDNTDDITIEEFKVDIINYDESISESLVSTNTLNIINSSLSESAIATELNTTQVSEINKTQDRELSAQQNPTEKMNTEIESAINQYKSLSSDEQQIKLAAMESEFTEKKQMELDAYNLLTENLHEFEIEQQVQSDLSSQVKKLRAELKLAEERLKVQQEKLSSIKSKIITNKSTVHDRRIECNNHERICTEMGLIVVGKEYKIPPIGDQSSRDAMKQVTSRIKRLRTKQAGSIDINCNSNHQSNDDASSVSSKDTGNNDDQLVSVKIENSIESLNPASVDYQSGNNCGEMPIGVSVKEEIVDFESESLPVNSEFTISHANSESELNQIGMNFIAKNEQDKESDEFNEIESRLTPIDPSLPEERCPMTQPIPEDNINVNLIEPKTENDTNLSLPVFSSAPSGDTSSLIRPIVKIPKQNYSSESILPVLNSARSLDPNVVLCPYDLNGKCKDDACKYSHLNRRSTS